MLDFDGNERASIQLRDSDLNKLQILLLQLQRKDLNPNIRTAALAEFFKTIDGRRANWSKTAVELTSELAALHRNIAAQTILWAAQPKKFTKEELAAGYDDASKRIFVTLDRWQRERESSEPILRC
jgi:hypothetical protein